MTPLPPGEGTDPPEGAGEVPELDPQFQEALREAARGRRPDPGDTAEYPAPEAPQDPPEAGDEAAQPEAPDEAAQPEAPDEATQPEARDEPVESEPAHEEGGGEEQEEADAQEATEGPEAQKTAERPVPTVVIGAGAEEVREAVSAAVDAYGWAPRRPASGGDHEPPPKRKRYWLRALLASFLIVGSFATATAVANLLQLTDWVDDIKPIPGIADRLVAVEGGEPQTFLILGSDKRSAVSGKEERGLSDTTILLRIDPDQNVIAILNIPRDLKVEIPGVGTNKFNAAYAIGGPKLALRTVQRLTAGMGLRINHLVNIDFLGFVRAINEIKCVYVDVDRRYFHSNAGLPAELQYDEIDIRPGYQKLCGLDALDYVRYRHTDTDLVRAARQQDFLRLARQRVPPSELFKELTGEGDLVDTFTAHTQSDIQDLGTMIDVLKLMIEARQAPIKEVHFPAVLGRSYVYASRPAIRDAINQFLGFEASGGPRGALESDLQQSEPRPAGAGGDRGGGGGRGPREQELRTPTPESDGLVNAAEGSRDVAKTAARKLGPGFPVFYPRRLPSGSVYVSNEDVSNPYVYHLNDADGRAHAAYRIVIQIPQGDYIGVQGLRHWEKPPILDDPSEIRTMGGREYEIYLSSDRVRLIAWHEDGNSYWVANSLLQTLTNDQMLGIARSIGEIVPNPKPRKRGKR